MTKVCKYTDTTHAATAVNIKKDAGGSYTTNGLTLDTMSSSSPYIRTLSATSMAAGNEGNYQCSVETASFTYTSPNARLIMLCKLQNSSQSTNKPVLVLIILESIHLNLISVILTPCLSQL